MFAPVVLPFQITCVVMILFLIIGLLRSNGGKAKVVVVCSSLLLFIPSCTAVMFAVDQFRYGRFEYASRSEMPEDGYIELPPTAQKITLYRNGAGHWAKFAIETSALMEWIEKMRALRPGLKTDLDGDEWVNNAIPQIQAEMGKLYAEEFANRFPDTGWQYKPSMNRYYVNRSDRGGGFLSLRCPLRVRFHTAGLQKRHATSATFHHDPHDDCRGCRSGGNRVPRCIRSFASDLPTERAYRRQPVTSSERGNTARR